MYELLVSSMKVVQQRSQLLDRVDRLICETGLETMDIVPSSDNTFNIGDPNTNVYSNVFSINGNFQVVSMANNGGDPTAPRRFWLYIYKNSQ